MAHVLVVDDDFDIREALTEVLRFEGYETISAVNGREALTILNAHPGPCLILLDYMMPEMNGHQFLEAVQGSLISHYPIVLLTAAHPSSISPMALQRAKEFVKKPVDARTLLSLAEKYIGPPPTRQPAN